MTLDTELSKLHEVVGVIDLPFEGKSMPAPDGAVYIEGLAAGLGRDRGGERFTPGVLSAAIAGYMKNPVLLWAHNMTIPMGEVIEARMVPKGLWIKAKVSEPAPNTPGLADIWKKVKEGVVKGLSVGGIFDKSPDGTVTHCELVEISLAPVPLNSETLCRVVGKAFTAGGDMNTELARLATLTAGSSSSLDSALERLAEL